jgi:hypothetical protein
MPSLLSEEQPGRVSSEVQNAVKAYLWSIDEGMKHDLTFENALTLARLAFEAQFQMDLKLLSMMATLPTGVIQ